jgi:hypothetical protein
MPNKKQLPPRDHFASAGKVMLWEMELSNA